MSIKKIKNINKCKKQKQKGYGYFLKAIHILKILKYQKAHPEGSHYTQTLSALKKESDNNERQCTDVKEKTEEIPTIFLPQIAELIQKKKISNYFMGLDMVFAESPS